MRIKNPPSASSGNAYKYLIGYFKDLANALDDLSSIADIE